MLEQMNTQERNTFSPLFIGEVSLTARFAPYFHQDTRLACRNSSKTPNLQEIPGDLRKSMLPVGCFFLSQPLPSL